MDSKLDRVLDGEVHCVRKCPKLHRVLLHSTEIGELLACSSIKAYV